MTMRHMTILVVGVLVLCGIFGGVHAQTNGLQIGGSAQVYVQDEGLKLRAGPGVNNTLIENLPSGTVVEIIGGPTFDGTYTWWNVRTPSGNEGWSVDGADGLQTLIPYDVAAAQGVEVVSTFEVYDFGIPYLVWSPDNLRVAFVTQTGLQAVAVDTGEPLFTISDLPVIAPALEWSSDGRWLRMTYNGEFVGYVDTNAGQVAAQIDNPNVDWLPAPDIAISQSDFDGQPIDELIIVHENGTLFGGNPASLVISEGELQLGNGEGGLNWTEGSPNVVIWSDANANDPAYTGSAEVWDISTGVRRAMVPHGSINLFAGASFSDAAFLSNDGSLLAAIEMGYDSNNFPFYVVTIYRLTDTLTK